MAARTHPNSSTDATAPEREPRSTSWSAAVSIRRISGVYVWVVLIIAFGLLTPDTFLTVGTARTVAFESAVTALVALAVMITLAVGEFDLAIAHTVGLSAVVGAKLMGDLGYPPVLAVVLTLAMGCVVGLVSGLLVTKARISSIIATLGVASILQSLIQLVSDSRQIVGLPEGFLRLSRQQVLGVPIPVYYVIVLTVILWYVMEHRVVGRHMYATGAGREAARLSGVNTTRLIIGSFVASSLVASFAGLILIGRIGAATPGLGPPYLLPAFAAAFLGATQFRAGRVNPWGTLVAVYLLATGVKGLNLLGAEVWVTDLFNGLALIVAVGFSNIQRFPRWRRREPTANAASQMTASNDMLDTKEPV